MCGCVRLFQSEEGNIFAAQLMLLQSSLASNVVASAGGVGLFACSGV